MTPDDPPDALDDRDAAAIELTVRFELPRWEATLADIGALAPGALIETGAGTNDPVISLWVGRRRIGEGQLVAVGDRMAVRVVKIAATGASPVTAPRPGVEVSA